MSCLPVYKIAVLGIFHQRHIFFPKQRKKRAELTDGFHNRVRKRRARHNSRRREEPGFCRFYAGTFSTLQRQPVSPVNASIGILNFQQTRSLLSRQPCFLSLKHNRLPNFSFSEQYAGQRPLDLITACSSRGRRRCEWALQRACYGPVYVFFFFATPLGIDAMIARTRACSRCR